jgi:alanine dehydrogenase
MHEVHVLTAEEIDGLARFEEYVEAVRAGYRQYGEGAPITPRITLENTDRQAVQLKTYIAVLPESGAMGGYLYTSVGEDQWYMTPLYDAETGEPKALLDGTALSPLKTGAVGGVAVDELARDDARTVGVYGSGPQARAQVRATAAVRDVERVTVYSPTETNAEALRTRLDGELDAVVETAADETEPVAGADIVITATSSETPVFDGDLLEAGAHVTAMGQHEPTGRELDETVIEQAKYVPDTRQRALDESGELRQAIERGAVTEDHIHGDLGAVVAGEKPGRETADEITVFDSGGTPIETVSAAQLAHQKGRDASVGTALPFSSLRAAIDWR